MWNEYPQKSNNLLRDAMATAGPAAAGHHSPKGNEDQLQGLLPFRPP